jgi:hypothetical protein
MRFLEGLSQVIAALVGILGATGYILVLGAVVLWIRLGEANFAKAVPLSLASREELIVIGAQALAVWFVLAIALVALAARTAENEILTRRDVFFDVFLGLLATVTALAAIHGSKPVVVALIAFFAVIVAVWVFLDALLVKPPLPAVAAAVLPATVGALLPLAVSQLSEDKNGVGTTVAAWATFLAVLLGLPGLRAQRASMANESAAIGELELRREGLLATAGNEGSASLLGEHSQILAELRAKLRAATGRFWLRGTALVLGGLLLLGGIAVASQFEKKHLFREAKVTLVSGRCLVGTYLARNKEQVVIGDQRGGDGPNRLLVLPAGDIKELQVKDPVGRGVRVGVVGCSKSPTPTAGTK